ncbi:MAG TPA: RNA polymerase subunit sigma-70 [Candidatus Rokubacteria bacterium]|nr:RNA polymerase subunit sigma-70 [Candidatus Rokubacteria bacterium]
MGRWRAEDDGSVENSDEALCRRVAERDEAAFDLLVERYRERAWRLAWSMLRDAEAARDVSQDAFIRLYEAAGSFAGRARFSTWFYRLLVNRCLDHRRRNRWWRLWARDEGEAPGGETLLERQPAPAYDPGDALSREQAVSALWAAVDRLPPRQRAVVTLQAQEELSTAEIADVLKCSQATVRVHLHRALKTLRRTLEKR